MQLQHRRPPTSIGHVNHTGPRIPTGGDHPQPLSAASNLLRKCVRQARRILRLNHGEGETGSNGSRSPIDFLNEVN